MYKNKTIICGVLLLFLMSALFTGCSKQEEKNSIVIGASRSLTGPHALVGSAAFEPIFKMWIKQVNAEGGIYIKEYKKKLPIETIIYDDESDEKIMIQNLEKLMFEDKVDFIFPPVGTHLVFTAAPILNKNGYLFMAAEGGAARIKEIIAGLPYFFSTLNYSNHYQVPVLADILESEGAKSAAIVFIADDHGVEYSSFAVPELALKGINVALIKSVPLDVTDMSDIIREAKAANVDAFLSLGYPDQNFLAINQSMELGFNPKLFITGPGGNFEFFKLQYGAAAEGVMCWGAWNTKVSPGHKKLAEDLTKEYGAAIIDWWGHNIYYATLEFWKQAVEKAGTLDQEKIREIFATEKFDTILGPTWFDENHLLAVECHAGEVGQWQNGIFEVVGPPDKATASVVYPKPPWPSK